MLYYDRVDVSKGTDLAETNNSKEYMICYCWFFSHGFKFQDYVCSDCHDLTILSLNVSDIAIITVRPTGKIPLFPILWPGEFFFQSCLPGKQISEEKLFSQVYKLH